jgi:hypothetical protein
VKSFKFALILVSIVLFLSGLNATSSNASTGMVESEHDSSGLRSKFYLTISADQFITPSTTVIVNLPIIEQNVSMETPSPQNNVSESELTAPLETLTPTPTPIPQQSGSTNLPIVIGAAAIISVVVLAWLFVSYLPNKNKE